MNTIDKLNASRNLTKTEFLMFPDWFDKNEYKVSDYLQGGTMCKENGLTIDWFDHINFFAYEKCQIRNTWFIQCIARIEKTKTTKIITLIKK